MMASSQSFSMIQRRILLSPWPASPVKSDEPLWTSAMRLPSGVSCFILESLLTRNRSCPSDDRGSRLNSASPPCVMMKRGSRDAVLAAHAFEIGLPALAVGRVREHEVELAGSESVLRQRGAVRHVLRFAAFTLEQQVGFGDGVGLRIDFLSVQVNGNFFAVLTGKACRRSSATVSMPAGSASAVIHEVRAASRSGRRSGRKMRSAMSFTTSRGVKCSPASSLFSSLKRRISSSKIVPIA